MKCTSPGCMNDVTDHAVCNACIVAGRSIGQTNPVKQSLAAQYPKYYKPLPKNADCIDTYALNQMFPVDDPSGCILHARKKLLVPGVRSGGKSFRKDIQEARDTLNRWLELNPEEQ